MATRSTIQLRDKDGVIRHGGEWLVLWSDPDSLRTADQRAQLDAQRKEAIREAERVAAAARALSGDPHFRPSTGAGDDEGLLRDVAALAARRGRADSEALRSRFHDARIYRSARPSQPSAAKLFDLCERVRCECLGALRMIGVAENLVAAQRERLAKADLLNAHLASLVPVSEAMEMALRDIFLDVPTSSIATSAFWMWDRWLRAKMMPLFRGLKEVLGDQKVYGSRSSDMIERLFAELESRTPGERWPLVQRPGGNGTDTGEVIEGQHATISETHAVRLEPGSEIFPDNVQAEIVAPSPLEILPYRIFTRDFDRIVHADEIAPKEELLELRLSLDQKHSDLRRQAVRLAAKLQRKLLAKRITSWAFDLEEGILDAARLDRPIVNPGSALAYKMEKDSQFRDTAVTLLIDCSGSMRGKPIEIACLVADMACAALERCGIAVEVLGYTTCDWRGGNSALQWAKAGRAKNPGRLNDLCHLVFKPADVPYRRARHLIAAMLKPDLLKENVDGEALVWATDRLRARPEKRRVLLVVSDGAPADQATWEENDDRQILAQHLRSVIAAIEKRGEIEVLAVGLKYDVSQYFRTAAVINQADALGSAIFSALARVFEQD